MSYSIEVMQGRNLAELVSLCGECHQAATFTFYGGRRTKAETQSINQGLRERAVEHAANATRERLKSRKPKPPKPTIEEIRELSRRYAEGDIR